MKLKTLGHSNHDWPTFERLLNQHQIGCIADVRTRPRSRQSHFSAPQLRGNLNRIGISYIYLGDLLGGMPATGPDRYDDMAKSIEFKTGIARLLEVAPRTRLCLMCAEHDTIACHRTLLVGRHLTGLGVAIDHIARDGSVESQQVVEERLLVRAKIKTDLLRGRDELLAEAYHRQEQRLRGEPA